MTFAFAQPLKLLAIGGSLITSTSLWFFKPHVPLQTRSSHSPSPRVKVLDDDDNINLFTPAPKLTSYTPKDSEFDEKIKNPTVTKNPREISFTDSTTKTLDYTVWDEINDLKLENILGYLRQYKEINKDDIKIYLFKYPAWFSPTNRDEYEANPLTSDQISDLFGGMNETKTKQLLLSLYRSREWYEHSGKYIARIPHLSETSSPSKLTSLKVKYFTNFQDLKAYVHKKVNESCTDDFKACIANPSELTFLKADGLKYFA